MPIFLGVKLNVIEASFIHVVFKRFIQFLVKLDCSQRNPLDTCSGRIMLRPT